MPLNFLNTGYFADKVGIGTDSPSAKLDIKGDTTTWDGMAKIYFTDVSSNSASRNWSVGNGGTDYGALSFIVSNAKNGVPADSTGTAVMSMDGVNKRVGIGTISPGTKLDVIGTVRSYVSAGNYGQIENGSFQAVGDHGGTFMLDLDNTGTADLVNIKKSGSSKFYIKNNGNVGIGEANPAVPLHISKDSASGENIALLLDNNNTTAGNEIGILFRSMVGSTNTDFEIFGKANAANDMDLVFESDGSNERVRFTGDGNVGIGTASPAEPLTVKTKTDAYFPGIKVEDYNSSMGLYVQNIEGQNSGIGTGRYYNSGSWRSDVTAPTTIRLDGGAIRFYAQSGVTADANYTPTQRMNIAATGAIKFNAYDSTNNTGTPTYLLGTDGSGNIVKTNTIPGSDPGPYLPLAGGIMTGDVRFNDGVEIEVGTGRDLVITHDGSNSYIKQIGTGNLILRQSVDDGDIIFQSDNGSGGVATYFRLDGSLADGTFTFTSWGDNDKVTFGDSNDLQIYHNGSDSYIRDTGAGELRISASKTRFYDADLSHLQAEFTDGGSVDLYYSGNKKFETTSDGVTVTGQITTTGTSPSVLFNETDVTANWRNRVSSGSYRVQYASDGTTFSDYFVLGASANTVEKDTTFAGDIKIGSALLSNQNNTDVDTGTEAIASVVLATYTAAFFDFVIKKGTNVRSGTVYACHDGTNVEFTETSTQDLGDTSDVTLSVDISGGNMRLQATTTSDDWSVKSLIRAI